MMKKANSNRILVYSRKNKELLDDWKQSNRHNNYDYDFVSNAFDLTVRLNRENYKLTIIDGEAGDKDKDLLDAVSIAVASGQPTMIRKLHSGEPEKSTTVEGVSSRTEEKIDSATVGGREEGGDIDERHIVSAVAATLRHRINNPLMAISANVEMMLKNREVLDKDIIDKIEQIGLCAERIKDVTEQLTNLESIRFQDTAAGRMIDLESSDTENTLPATTPETSE